MKKDIPTPKKRKVEKLYSFHLQCIKIEHDSEDNYEIDPCLIEYVEQSLIHDQIFNETDAKTFCSLLQKALPYF